MPQHDLDPQQTGPAGDSQQLPAGPDPRSALRRFRVAWLLLMVAAGLLFISSKTGQVVTIERGETVEFRHAAMPLLFSAAAGASACLAAVYAIRSRIWPGLVFGIAAAVLGVFVLGLGLPGAARGRVVLARDRFVVPASGFWWTPPREIPLADLELVWIQTDEPARRTVTFVRKGDVAPDEVPLGDLLTAALPELRRRAAALGAHVLDNVE